ncbi:unnamed protein product, partial [Allacma fusca]
IKNSRGWIPPSGDDNLPFVFSHCKRGRRVEIIGFPSVSLPLEMRQVERERGHRGKALKAHLCTSKVCGDTVTGVECGEEVNNWLSTVFNRPGLKLLHMTQEQSRTPRNAIDEISLANFSQFLLVSMGSLRHLAEELLDRNVDFIQSYSSHEDSQIQESSQSKLDSPAHNENQDNGRDEESESEIRTGCSRIDQNGDQDRVRLQQKPHIGSSPITTSTIGNAGLTPLPNGKMRKVHQNEKERLEITKVGPIFPRESSPFLILVMFNHFVKE